MRFFKGLHRIVIVIAVCLAVGAGKSAYDDYSRRERYISYLKSTDLEVSMDGKSYRVPPDATKEELYAAAASESLTLGKEIRVIIALEAEQKRRRQDISMEEESAAGRWLDPFISVVIGLVTYLGGLTVLLVGRWIIRGFLTPSADRTDTNPSG